MTANIIDTTWSNINISAAATPIYTYTAAANGRVSFQWGSPTVSGSGDYAYWLTKNRLGTATDAIVGGKTTQTLAAGETTLAAQSLPLDVKTGDVIKVYVDGLAGDTSRSGWVFIEVENYSTHTASDVWAVSVRSLTTYGTLVADVWAYVTRTLTQTAASVIAAVAGSSLTLTNKVTFTATMSGLTIPATWTEIRATVKSNKRLEDSAATLQILVSNPANAATDGITYYLGEAATVAERAYGSLTVNQGAGTIVWVVEDETDFVSVVGSENNPQGYDVKAKLSSGKTQQIVPSSPFVFDETETRTA